MSSIRVLFVLTFVAALAGIHGCSGGASASCSDVCNKQQTCGDIDSVMGDQCRAKCSADADVSQAFLDACVNKSDIESAVSQCLSRACLDYAACLTTVPSCVVTPGSSSTSSGGPVSSGTGPAMPGGLSCDETSGSDHVCIEISSSTITACPSGSTTVSACSTVGLLGSCSITSTGITEAEFFYAGGSVTAASAQQACTASNGTWTP